MKWKTTVSSALAVGGLLALFALLTHERGQTAEEFLLSVEARRAAGKLSPEQLLRELQLAVDQAQHEGTLSVAARAQLERGRVLLDLGSFDGARSEFEAVSSAGGGGAELELLRIELELRAGNPAEGLTLAGERLRLHPEDARAWNLAGELRRLQAAGPREEALQSCRKDLVIESAARAEPCVRELCARPESDPRRVALARDLRELYGPRLEAAAERVLGLCDAATVESAAAREAFGRCLELGFDPEVLATLAELLEEAGLGEQALDLLTAAAPRPELSESLRANSFLLRTLVARQRWRHAILVATNWLQTHPGGPQFLLDACRAAYGAMAETSEHSTRLYNWSTSLSSVREASLGFVPSFYTGEAFFAMRTRGMLEYAYFHLSTFALSPGPDPFPGSRALAFRHLAECCQVLGKSGEERSTLETAVELDPRGSGESWLRLAELQLAAPHGGFRTPDLRWARGMALLPAREEELLPRWLEIGTDELRALGIDPRNLQQDLAGGARVRVSSGAAPFELYTLVRACIEAQRFSDALTLLQELETAVPDFLPALELRAQIALARGDTRALAEAFLKRLELVGLDERARALRDALPADALSGADLRRVVRADPDTSGRLAVARSYAARGERAAALRFLEGLPKARFGPQERLLAARLELDSGLVEPAFARLDALGDDLVASSGALEAWIEAGMRAQRADALRERLPARLGALELERPRFLALADRLLASGEASLARLALQRLDTGGRSFRGGDVLWRLAACAQSLGQADAYQRLSERAAAFDTKGELELLQLLALPADADADARASAVEAVRRAGWKASPLARAALAALAGDPAALEKALAAVRAQNPAEPLLPLLAPGSEEALAREIAGLVLALERPALGALARLRLEAIGERAGALAPAWARARLHRAAGEREAEERALRGLLEVEPACVAAWDRLLELHTEAQDEGEGPLALRLERAAALGESSGTPAERDWDRSRRLESEGAFEAALDAARAAVVAAPDSGPILRHLGRLSMGQNRLPAALAAYRRALLALPSSSGARSTGEFLELLELARGAEPPLLDAEGERKELEALAELRPEDPRVLLAQARNDLETSGTDPAFGAERAAARLAGFRERQRASSFEQLASGGTEGWVHFLLALDPARARAFLESELERDPGNLAGWALLPRCSAAGGRDADALSEVAFVQRLAPGAEGLSEYLRVRARGDWTAEGVAIIAERLRRIDPKIGSSPTELATEMRAFLNLGPRGVPKALQVGAALTPARLATQPAELRADVYWMYAVALLSRGAPEDLAQARLRLLVLDKLVREPSRAPLLATLRGLALAPKPARP